MYIKIDLSSELMDEIAARVDADNSLVREDLRIDNHYSKLRLRYDVFDFGYDVYFGVWLTFLSHGNAFAYCTCGFDFGKRCIHIDEVLLFHQERCRNFLEKSFGADVIEEESVF